jgi:hypothetical protein
MPNKRHRIIDLGAVTVGNESEEIQIGEFTKGLLFLDSTVGAVVDVEVSPDGTNWYKLYDAEADQIQFTTTLAKETRELEFSAQYMRFAVATQNVAGMWFEGVREVA